MLLNTVLVVTVAWHSYPSFHSIQNRHNIYTLTKDLYFHLLYSGRPNTGTSLYLQVKTTLIESSILFSLTLILTSFNGRSFGLGSSVATTPTLLLNPQPQLLDFWMTVPENYYFNLKPFSYGYCLYGYRNIIQPYSL